MKNDFYIQCIIIHNNDRILTTWLPEKFAIKDKMICLKGDKGVWESGWRVSHIYNLIKKTKSEAMIDAAAYKHHREITDT